MARPKKLIPSYRRHRASGQAIVTINGVDHYLGRHGTKASEREYDRLVSEWLESGRSPSFGTAASDLTIAELLVGYLKHAKAYYGDGARGEFANMKRVATPLRELYARTKAVEFGPLQLKAVRRQFVDGGASRSYANACTRRVVRIFRWAVADGLLPAAVPDALAAVPGLRAGRSEARETAKVKPVSVAMVEQTIPHLSSVVAAMVAFQRYTGCRPGEVCNLRAGDVRRDGKVWEAELSEHKTAHLGKSRILFIGPRAQEVITAYLLRPADGFCFDPREALEERRERDHANRTTPLSCGNRRGTNVKRNPKRKAGDHYTTQSYARAISRACELAYPAPDDLEGDALKAWRREHSWSPNQLRHLLATEVRREHGLEASKVLLGHSAIGVTQHYAEIDRGKALEIAAKIG